MFSKWFALNLAIDKTIAIKSDTEIDAESISSFLDKQGYRNICIKDSVVSAVRGHKIMNLINIGNPRRNYHSIEISIDNDIKLKTTIDTWFGIGTKHDKEVFISENVMLDYFIRTGNITNEPLVNAQRQRRKSDIKIIIPFFSICIIIGIILRIILS